MTGVMFEHLRDVAPSSIVSLMNDPLVRRHLPLAEGVFTTADCERFIESKERMWAESGYGPWALLEDGEFLGWGGLQPVSDDAELGLVLCPSSWGIGRAMYRRFVSYAFEELQLESVIAMLPHSRTRGGGLTRLGFVRDGEYETNGVRFLRFRLFESARTGFLCA